MGKRWWRKSSLRAAVLLQLALATANPVQAGSGPWDELQAVDDRELADMRGGYASPSGLEISFGIEQAVFIDGILQAVTTFNTVSPLANLPDPRLVVQNTGVISDSGVRLFQNGLTPMTMDAEALRSQLFTVVQNSQDNRVIDSITRIDATVHGLDAFRDSRFLSSFQQQMIETLR